MEKTLSGSEIRQSFIEFFLERDHTFVPSASLVPGGDQTLLFTNAGMVQFKDIFLGTDKRPYTRAVNSQKCLRVAGKHNDLDEVGRDDTHHTFFEMLGNWSFGDYYKKEAIQWAWELLTQVWQLDKSRLWMTVFKDEYGQIPTDDEAFDQWKIQPGIDASHILYFGRKDNLWEMAETGPCGPCSEIHYDFGAERCTRKNVPGHQCEVNGDCGRFLEIWNLVFIQYNRLDANTFQSLPQKHVDTGMGFERIVSILQNVDSNYKTDLFTPILDTLQVLTGHNDETRQEMITPYRVIGDHIRTASFLIADGVIPGNVARNYVCRMIIRRAALFGRKIGLMEPFLYKLSEIVVNEFGDAYPELVRSKEIIRNQLFREEVRFQKTVENGLTRLTEMLDLLSKSETKILRGEDAFDLYATHGLPLEITRDIVMETGYDVDEKGFRKAMEAHRALSSASRVAESGGMERSDFFGHILEDLVDNNKLTTEGVEYNPYSDLERTGELLVILKNGILAVQAEPGDQIEVVIPSSPFYIESGGQVADTGWLTELNGTWEIAVENSHRVAAGMIAISGKVVKGSPQIGDATIARVDHRRRMAIMRNHTATHLLHAALQKVLGEHARQSGSLVSPEYLRFDFTHPEAITAEELHQIEEIVNRDIYSEIELRIAHKNLDEAVKDGATALFGEKYGQVVRTVRIGNHETISYELCGGTHVENTGEIGIFLIQSEGSIASGIRRIEAVTGEGAYEVVRTQLDALKRSSRILNTGSEEVPAKITGLLEELDQAKKQIQQLIQKNANFAFDEQLKNTRIVNGIPVLAGIIPDADIDTLRSLSDQFKNRYPSGVAVLGSVSNEKPVLIIAVTEDLVARGLDAVKMVRVLAKEIGGGGGGKSTLAQAGGKFADKLPTAVQMTGEYITTNLSEQ
ncbi:MAG: alanine--tRNA ligase [Chloroflexi bacterium]|nr:alanine--tRNA ligase [Chloroflexota bacterium]